MLRLLLLWVLLALPAMRAYAQTPTVAAPDTSQSSFLSHLQRTLSPGDTTATDTALIRATIKRIDDLVLSQAKQRARRDSLKYLAEVRLINTLLSKNGEIPDTLTFFKLKSSGADKHFLQSQDKLQLAHLWYSSDKFRQASRNAAVIRNSLQTHRLVFIKMAGAGKPIISSAKVVTLDGSGSGTVVSSLVNPVTSLTDQQRIQEEAYRARNTIALQEIKTLLLQYSRLNQRPLFTMDEFFRVETKNYTNEAAKNVFRNACITKLVADLQARR